MSTRASRLRRPARATALAAAYLALAACGDDPLTPPTTPGTDDGPFVAGVASYGYEVTASYAHDPGAFTQGLVYREGRLYESTGLRGRSSVREVELETGEVLRRTDLADRYFGEGLALHEGRAIQLTWTSGTGFVYDPETLEVRETFGYDGEGWGLTHDGARLILSDGTPRLRFLDPESFAVVDTVVVTDIDGRVVVDLNELEYVAGRVLANVWQTDRIAVIDPETGRVEAWIDLAGILPAEDAAGVDVLNGIAWDRETDELLVTGKLWPTLFRIRLVPR